jgi:hypothetical protein
MVFSSQPYYGLVHYDNNRADSMYAFAADE